MVSGHPEDFMQKGTACIIKPLLVSGNTKGLTGKASAQNLIFRDLGDIDFSQVAYGTLPIILEVGELGILIPIRGKNTGVTTTLESLAETTDSTK
tara:strand:- start:704 stop:988 length:285 start_codon:yes stop_codon:yes gene_type:complete